MDPSFEHVDKTMLEDTFIISEQISEENENDCLYYAFNKWDDFVKFYEAAEVKRFYEVIMGAQKPHFDINIPVEEDHEAIFNTFMDALKQSLAKRGIPEDNIMVFDSSGDTVKSYHVVVQGYYLKDGTAMYSFYWNTLRGTAIRNYVRFNYSRYGFHKMRIMESVKTENGEKRVKRATKPCELLDSLVTYIEGAQLIEEEKLNEEEISMYNQSEKYAAIKDAEVGEKTDLNVLKAELLRFCVRK